MYPKRKSKLRARLSSLVLSVQYYLLVGCPVLDTSPFPNPVAASNPSKHKTAVERKCGIPAGALHKLS